MAKVAVIYYSATGNVRALAQAVAEGAAEAGAEVRLRRVAEPTADAGGIEVATVDDVRWADGLAFGTPARFGNVSAALKLFLESVGPLWMAGELTNKVATGFTSANNVHGGHESTLLALHNTLYHWGAIVAAPGFTDAVVVRGGGNPYGTSHAAVQGAPGDEVLAAARYQGRRLAAIATLIAAGGREERIAA